MEHGSRAVNKLCNILGIMETCNGKTKKTCGRMKVLILIESLMHLQCRYISNTGNCLLLLGYHVASPDHKLPKTYATLTSNKLQEPPVYLLHYFVNDTSAESDSAVNNFFCLMRLILTRSQ